MYSKKKFIISKAKKNMEFIKTKFKILVCINFLKNNEIITQEIIKKSEENPKGLSEKQSMKKPQITAKIAEFFILLNIKKPIANGKTKKGFKSLKLKHLEHCKTVKKTIKKIKKAHSIIAFLK